MAQKQYFTNFIPDFDQQAIAGANFKTKKAGRPFIFDARTFITRTKNDGIVLMHYLLFGGVPSPKLHAKLEEVGFKVRRRPRTWKAKDGKVVDIATRDNNCYVVYYNTQPNVWPEQVEVMGKIYAALNAVCAGKGNFLSTTWEGVEERWGSKEDWLSICAVDNTTTKQSKSSAVEEEENDDTGSLLNDIDALI